MRFYYYKQFVYDGKGDSVILIYLNIVCLGVNVSVGLRDKNLTEFAMQPSEMASLSNSKWQNRKERPIRS